MKRLLLSPTPAAFVILIFIFILRAIDILVIRSDELMGEQILTKVVGLLIILAYVLILKGNLGVIGIHSEKWIIAIFIGLFIMIPGLVLGYLAEWLVLYMQGSSPQLILQPQGNSLIPGLAMSGGLLFAVTLIIGNIINSFMEEGLFRGILITHLGSQFRLPIANLIQASLFGIWHIFWPIRDFMDGRISFLNVFLISIGYILLAGMMGFAWGYLFQKTGSLWASWASHTLNNSTYNIFQISTPLASTATLGLRTAISTCFVLLLLPLVAKMTKYFSMNQVKTWESRN